MVMELHKKNVSPRGEMTTDKGKIQGELGLNSLTTLHRADDETDFIEKLYFFFIAAL